MIKTIITLLPITALLAIMSICITIIFSQFNGCSSGNPIKLSNFEKCLNAIGPPQSVWTLIGSITVEKIDSATLEKCETIGKLETRNNIIKEHATATAKTTDEARKTGKLTDRQKLIFIMDGIQKRVEWNK